jgi:hypothetical protein
MEWHAAYNRKALSLKREETPMTNTRSLVISISWAVLLAVPLICAQDVKTPDPVLTLQHLGVIQELQLRPTRFLMFPLQAETATPVIDAQDLSRYREFQLGMNLLAVAKQAGVVPSEARAIHQRPALIQELEWRPQGSLSSSPQADRVSEVLFNFYNGEPFRMVVNYDQHRTEGVTDEDIVEAISTKYGTATKPEAKIILFSSFPLYNDSEKVIAPLGRLPVLVQPLPFLLPAYFWNACFFEAARCAGPGRYRGSDPAR